MTEFTYKIGGKKYTQKPLVLGQIRQLIKAIEGMVIPRGIDTPGLIVAFGDKLPLALAIALTPEGMSPKDKDIHSLAGELEFEISPEETVQAVEDFFDCNPILSFLERIGKMSDKVNKAMTGKTGSKSSPVSSPEEILLSETISSGGTP